MNVQISSISRRSKDSNDIKICFSLSHRFVTEEKVLEIEVEPGVTDGYEIPFHSDGNFEVIHLPTLSDLFSVFR